MLKRFVMFLLCLSALWACTDDDVTVVKQNDLDRMVEITINAGVDAEGSTRTFIAASGDNFWKVGDSIVVEGETVPVLSLEETEYGISVKIMMPITKPAFASMAILCAMGSWNNMLWPMLVFRDTNKFTLQIGLNTLLTPYGNTYDLLIAGSMFGIIPILVIYLIFQRYLIEGMTSGAVKG